METARVDVIYRPLRVGFVLTSTDRVSVRKAIRLCNALWGGRYNPILAVDRPEVSQLVEVFRPDFLVPLGDDPAVVAFVDAYPYLANPLFPDKLFFAASPGREGQMRLLDIQNMIVRWRETPEWKRLVEDGFRVPRWRADDPLSDAFLIQFGEFPDPEEFGIDYARFAYDSTNGFDIDVSPNGVIPAEILNHPVPAHFSRFALKPHYSSPGNWIYPGLYVGEADCIDDIINFWNLRACGMSLLFHDLRYSDRFSGINFQYLENQKSQLAAKDELHRNSAIWTSRDIGNQIKNITGEGDFIYCRLNVESWNGNNIRPARMFFGEEVSLGIISGGVNSPRIRFALKEKPFSDDVWFYQQHLVASVSLIGSRTDGFDYTFLPPFIPELNEFVARAMHHGQRTLRLEPESVGIIIDAADHDVMLNAISVPTLIEQIFELSEFSARISSGGLIARQLISRMGGIDGARAFKIPGVRKLLKTHGPNASFTRKGALLLIGQSDPSTGAKFSDHHRLFIEPRDHETDLTPQMVFSHLVEKGLFRIGVDLRCPSCALTSWTPLDSLTQKVSCALCGNDFDATKQLVEGEYAYRRSGVLGIEKNTQGSVPVALLLQQLSANLLSLRNRGLFGVSYDLSKKSNPETLRKCEIDFCVISPTLRSNKTTVVIGECKDSGGKIDHNDIFNLNAVANSFPIDRFDVIIFLVKLSEFTKDEIDCAKTLNINSWDRRVVLLTERELEPYFLFERVEEGGGLDFRSNSAQDLAEVTHKRYFIAQKSP